MNNLKKVAKLIPQEKVEPKKESKSLTETIVNMESNKQQLNELGDTKKGQQALIDYLKKTDRRMDANDLSAKTKLNAAEKLLNTAEKTGSNAAFDRAEEFTNMAQKQVNNNKKREKYSNMARTRVLNTNYIPESKSIKEYFKERMSNRIDSKEEINELSNQTYSSYAEKAKGQIPGLEGASKAAWQRANMQWDVKRNTQIAIRSANKAKRRAAGIELAKKLRGR